MEKKAVLIEKMIKIANEAKAENPHDKDMRARCFFARLCGHMHDEELANELARALGFEHLIN